MAMVLRPQIDLNDDRWEDLLAKYKLDSVMTASRIKALWRRIRTCSSPVIWYELQDRQTVAAAVTLGPGIDRLQEDWCAHSQLLDAYAVDCLSMEALQCLYRVLEKELQRQGLFICHYIFTQTETEADGRAEMSGETDGTAADVNGETGQLLEMLSADIYLTAEGMMHPLKSVVYRGILSENAEKRCGSVCGGCSRRGCPYGQPLHMDNYRETGVLKYSYGYQRIFGQK